MGLCFSVLVCGRQLFLYSVESVIGCYEGTDALAEVTDLDVDIPQEGANFP